MASQQPHLLEACLWRPEWLHSKLRAYGVASIVADFRRWVLLLCSRCALA